MFFFSDFIFNVGGAPYNTKLLVVRKIWYVIVLFIVCLQVIKQTVMTTVYGVTRYGAKAQILRQLKDIPEFPQAHAWNGSIYLTEKTFQCLNEMFSATKDIQVCSARVVFLYCQLLLL